jgi:hypothetical protein
MDDVTIARVMSRPFLVRRTAFACCSRVAVEAVTNNASAMMTDLVVMMMENVAELRGVRP